MLEKLVDYLSDKYKPVTSIILHGSRASGYAKENSDWDFIILVDEKNHQKEFRANIEGQEIEFEVHQLPINENDVISKFGSKLKHAKILFDTNNKAEKILEIAQSMYLKGIPKAFITGKGLLSRKSTLQSAINGMKDNVDDPAMFLKKLGTFYPRVINMWYWFKEESYSDNLYISLPYIKKKDPLFYNELVKVYSFNTKPLYIIVASENLFNMIFE